MNFKEFKEIIHIPIADAFNAFSYSLSNRLSSVLRGVTAMQATLKVAYCLQ